MAVGERALIAHPPRNAALVGRRYIRPAGPAVFQTVEQAPHPICIRFHSQSGEALFWTPFARHDIRCPRVRAALDLHEPAFHRRIRCDHKFQTDGDGFVPPSKLIAVRSRTVGMKKCSPPNFAAWSHIAAVAVPFIPSLAKRER